MFSFIISSYKLLISFPKRCLKLHVTGLLELNEMDLSCNPVSMNNSSVIIYFVKYLIIVNRCVSNHYLDAILLKLFAYIFSS